MRFLKWFVFFLLCITITLVILAFVYEKRVEKLFVKKVNEQLTTELIVKEDISFSLLRNFPSASLSFYGIELRESLPQSQQNLLEAKELSFLFGWWDVFFQEYNIQKMAVIDGQLRVKTLQNGQTNFDILQPTPSDNQPKTTAASSFDLKIEQALFENVRVHYINEQVEQEVNIKLEDISFSGNFGAKQYDLTTVGNFVVDKCYLYDVDYLPKKKGAIDLTLQMDIPNNKYTFEKSTLAIEGNLLELIGYFAVKEKHTLIDCTLKGIDLDIATLLQLLPKEQAPAISGLKSQGNFNFDAKIKGKYSKTQQPRITANMVIKDGTFEQENWQHPIEQITTKITFSNGFDHTLTTAKLDIKQLSFQTLAQRLEAKATIKNFDDPIINATINGNVDLSFLGSDALETIKDIQGIIVVDEVKMEGKLANYTQSNAYPILQGRLATNDLSLIYNDKKIDTLYTSINIDGKNWEIQEGKLSTEKNDLQVKGNIAELTPLLFQSILQDSLTLHKPAKVNIDVTSTKLDVVDLLNFMTEEEKTDTLPDTTQQEFEIPSERQDFVIGAINLNFDHIDYDKLTIQDITGKLTFNDRKFIIQQILLKTLEGELDIRGDFEITKDRNLIVKAFMDCRGLDMQEFLADFDNFGQEMLTSENIEGLFSSKVFMKAYFDNRLRFEKEKFKMVADLVIENGTLINFEPMMALSSFVKLSELERVRFARLENQIEIKYQKLRIPSMFINSNVVQLTLSGMHTFENRLLYYIKLNLLDILTGKFKRKNKNINTRKNNRGGINVFLTMQGKADNPKISYMKKRMVKKKFKRDEQQKKQDLEKIMNEEFSLNRAIPIPFHIPSEQDSIELEVIEWRDTTKLN